MLGHMILFHAAMTRPGELARGREVPRPNHDPDKTETPRTRPAKLPAALRIATRNGKPAR